MATGDEKGDLDSDDSLYLDVSGLPAPEPLETIVNRLAKLQHGETLHVYHRQDPCLLYPYLDENGFAWTKREEPQPGGVHLFISRRDPH